VSKLTPAKPEEVIKVLEKLGFRKVRQSGSHAIFYHSGGRWTTVPVRKGCGKGHPPKDTQRCKDNL
jgi:predicted RNA binding protein YcfA (HicA-like mRNA interferase family)